VSVESDCTDDSITLKDGAVQPATKHMAVMEDLLWLPELSAQEHADDLASMHCRPRSRTAPSTPLVEAPCAEPVELLGSILMATKPSASLHHSLDDQQLSYPFHSPAAVGMPIGRSHSSPQKSTQTIPFSARQRSASNSYFPALSPSTQLPPRVMSTSPHQPANAKRLAFLNNRNEGPPVAPETYETTPKLPSLDLLHSSSTKASSLPGFTDIFEIEDTQTVPRLVSNKSDLTTLRPGQTQRLAAEEGLTAQISLLRASHEAHLSSLRNAHEKELASYRSYITFLEGRRIPLNTPPADSSQHLTVGMTHAGWRYGEPPTSDASAETFQSHESLIRPHTWGLQETTVETEALKRKLSLAHKSLVDSSGLRQECDHLREAAVRSNEKLSDVVRKGKESEASLRNANADLESRLTHANNERTHLLDGYRKVCEQLRLVRERERSFKQELEDLRNCLIGSGSGHASDMIVLLPSATQSVRSEHSRTVFDLGGLANRDDPWPRQLQQVKYLAVKEDARIHEFENHCRHTPEPDGQAADRTNAPEAALLEHKQTLAEGQADPKCYNSLLPGELGRQSKYVLEHTYAASTDDAEASGEVSENVRSGVQATSGQFDDSRTPTHSDSGIQEVTNTLEKQVEHCLEEIMMYKSDMQGYDQDAGKAQAEIESLSESGESFVRRRLHAFASYANPSTQIEEKTMDLDNWPLQPPRSPTRSIASATSLNLASQATPSLSDRSEFDYPPFRLKTPPGSHKKLPKPPNASPTPNPSSPQEDQAAGERGGFQRGGSLRSLSESICSSCTMAYRSQDVVPEWRDLQV